MVKSKTVKYSLIYSITVTLLSYLFSDKILNIFTSDINLVNLAIPIIRIVIATFPLVGIIYTLITFMQVSGEEDSASKLELMRQIVVLIPLVIILPILFSKFNIMNISPEIAVFLAIPMSTIILVTIYWKKVISIFINK